MNAASLFVDTGQHPVERPRPKLVARPRVHPPRRYNAVVEALALAVAPHFQVTAADVLGDRQHGPIVKARALCVHVARHRYGHTQQQLGAFFGRDHRTIANALKRADRLLAADAGVAHLVNGLMRKETVC